MRRFFVVYGCWTTEEPAGSTLFGVTSVIYQCVGGESGVVIGEEDQAVVGERLQCPVQRVALVGLTDVQVPSIERLGEFENDLFCVPVWAVLDHKRFPVTRWLLTRSK